jgi:hypothetical protein
MKFNQGLSIRLYFQNNSTVLTVLGLTILTESAIKITSKITAGTIQEGHTNDIEIIGIIIRKIGITIQSIFLKLKIKVFILYIIIIFCNNI